MDMNRAKRTCWRQEEKTILKLSFENNPNPDAIELNRLAQMVNKDTDRVLNWFKNERARLRRNGLEPIQGFLMTRQPQANNSNNGNNQANRDRIGRVFWTKRARARLVEFYEEQRNPSQEQVMRLAMELSTEPIKIQNWIKNHRQRERERLRATTGQCSPAITLPMISYKENEDDDVDVEEVDDSPTEVSSSSSGSEVPNYTPVNLPYAPNSIPNQQQYAMMAALMWQRQLALVHMQRLRQMNN